MQFLLSLWGTHGARQHKLCVMYHLVQQPNQNHITITITTVVIIRYQGKLEHAQTYCIRHKQETTPKELCGFWYTVENAY